MLSYNLEKRGQLPLYEYLYRCIKADISSGVLTADDRLPSKRQLADHLGVSLITVEGAYRQLLAEGYIYTRPRRGYYVSSLPALPVSAAPAVYTPQQGSSRASIAASRGVVEPSTSIDRPLLADFTRPNALPNALAADLWGKTIRSALAHEPQEVLFENLPMQGSPRLRHAIAEYLRSSRGMRVDESCILIGAGAQMLYTYLSLLFGAKAPVALENPGYPRLLGIYRALGHDICPIDLDQNGIDTFQLERSRAQLAHVMPSHQFPTGCVMSVARRYELLSWASRRPERYIIEDDYDWEFRFAGKPIPSLQSIDVKDKVIYLSTFSKSLSSALRVAFAVVPASLMERLDSTLGFLTNTVSALDQVALACLIESGDYEKHLNRYKKQARALRDKLVCALEGSAFKDRLSIHEKDSGLHFVMEVESDLPDSLIANRAFERGVALAPMSSYLISSHFPSHDNGIARFVMQYDSLDASKIPDVVRVLEEAIS